MPLCSMCAAPPPLSAHTAAEECVLTLLERWHDAVRIANKSTLAALTSAVIMFQHIKASDTFIATASGRKKDTWIPNPLWTGMSMKNVCL